MKTGRDNSVIAGACFFGLLTVALVDLVQHLITGTPL